MLQFFSCWVGAVSAYIQGQTDWLLSLIREGSALDIPVAVKFSSPKIWSTQIMKHGKVWLLIKKKQESLG